MENFFNGCIKLDQVRPRYKELAFKYHPDRNPANPDDANEMMKIINNQYHETLKRFEGTKLFNHKTKEEYAYRYDYKKESQIAEKIDQVVGLKLDNITLEIIGEWLWVHGASKEQASLFNKNGAGFKFSRGHIAWFWHRAVNAPARARSGLSLDQIRNVYGSETIEHDRNKQLA